MLVDESGACEFKAAKAACTLNTWWTKFKEGAKYVIFMLFEVIKAVIFRIKLPFHIHHNIRNEKLLRTNFYDLYLSFNRKMKDFFRN